MAILPTVGDYGARPNPSGAMPVATVRNAGAQGQALEQFGQQVANTGAMLQDVTDTALLKERDAYVSEQIRQTLYDPESGYMNQFGRSAVEARQAAIERLEALRKTSVDGMSNQAKTRFESTLNSRLDSAMTRIDTHSASEKRGWLNQASSARITAAQNDALYSDNVAQSFGVIASELRQTAAREGWASEKLELEMDQALSGLHYNQAMMIAQDNPLRAMEYLDTNRGDMTAAQAFELQTKLEPEAKAYRGRAIGAAAAKGIAPVERVVEAGAGYTVVQLSTGETVRRDGTRAWRNNNPGNIEFGDFAKRYGAIGTDGRFAVFPTYEAGRAAKKALLFDTDSYRGLTIQQAISRYAPDFENDSYGYASQVAQSVGVGTGTQMSTLTTAQREQMLDAMERVEGYQEGTQKGGSPMGVGGLMDIEDPDVRAAALQEYDLITKVNEGQRKAQIQAATSTAFQYVEAGNDPARLDLDVRQALGMEAMNSLRTYYAKVQGGEATTDPEAYQELRMMQAQDPQAFRALNVLTYADRLSQSDLKSFIDEQAKPISEERGSASSTLMTTAARQLRSAGYDTNAKPGSDDAKSLASIQTRLLRWQDGFIAQNGREPTQTEIDARIGRELTDVVINPPGFLNEFTGTVLDMQTMKAIEAGDLPDTDIRIGEVDVPPQVVAEQIAAMEAEGIDVTAEALVSRLLDLMSGGY